MYPPLRWKISTTEGRSTAPNFSKMVALIMDDSRTDISFGIDDGKK
jgi:hypothetical protein